MINLQEWVGRYLRRQEEQRPGFIVTNDLWNELWNLVIGQGDYNTETLRVLIDEFITEKERTQSILLPSNIKAGVNVSIARDDNTNDIYISAGTGGETGGISKAEAKELIEDAIVQYDTAVLEPFRDYLETQTDGKINTFAQETDPATHWTTEALQAEHAGDVWFNANDTKTYIWANTIWEELTGTDATTAEQLALQGVQIFTDTPTPPYYIGDLCQIGTGRLYYCATSRTSGLFDVSEWRIATEYLDAKMTATIDRLSLAELTIREDSIISTVASSTQYKEIIAGLDNNSEEIEVILEHVVANSTAIEQNDKDITFHFNSLNEGLTELATNVNEDQALLKSYIRFAGDTITLGKAANTFTAVLSSSELAFMEGSDKVAYISNNTMYITTAHVTDKFTVGKTETALYDIFVKKNGNLAIKRRS